MQTVLNSGPTTGALTEKTVTDGWCLVFNKELKKFKFARSAGEIERGKTRGGVVCGHCVKCGRNAELVDTVQGGQGGSTLCVDCHDEESSTVLLTFGHGGQQRQTKQVFVDSATTWEDVVRELWQFDGKASGVGPVGGGGAHASRWSTAWKRTLESDFRVQRHMTLVATYDLNLLGGVKKGKKKNSGAQGGDLNRSEPRSVAVERQVLVAGGGARTTRERPVVTAKLMASPPAQAATWAAFATSPVAARLGLRKARPKAAGQSESGREKQLRQILVESEVAATQGGVAQKRKAETISKPSRAPKQAEARGRKAKVIEDKHGEAENAHEDLDGNVQPELGREAEQGRALWADHGDDDVEEQGAEAEASVSLGVDPCNEEEALYMAAEVEEADFREVQDEASDADELEKQAEALMERARQLRAKRPAADIERLQERPGAAKRPAREGVEVLAARAPKRAASPIQASSAKRPAVGGNGFEVSEVRLRRRKVPKSVDTFLMENISGLAARRTLLLFQPEEAKAVSKALSSAGRAVASLEVSMQELARSFRAINSGTATLQRLQGRVLLDSLKEKKEQMPSILFYTAEWEATDFALDWRSPAKLLLLTAKQLLRHGPVVLACWCKTDDIFKSEQVRRFMAAMEEDLGESAEIFKHPLLRSIAGPCGREGDPLLDESERWLELAVETTRSTLIPQGERRHCEPRSSKAAASSDTVGGVENASSSRRPSSDESGDEGRVLSNESFFRYMDKIEEELFSPATAEPEVAVSPIGRPEVRSFTPVSTNGPSAQQQPKQSPSASLPPLDGSRTSTSGEARQGSVVTRAQDSTSQQRPKPSQAQRNAFEGKAVSNLQAEGEVVNPAGWKSTPLHYRAIVGGDTGWNDATAQRANRVQSTVSRDTLRQLTDTTRSLKFEQLTLEGVCEALERFADLAQLEEGDCNLLCGTLCAKLVESTRHCGRVKQLQAVWNTKLVSQGWVEFRRILLGDDADAAEGRDTAREIFGSLKPGKREPLAAYGSRFAVACSKARQLGVDNGDFKALREKFTRSLPESSRERQVAVTLQFADSAVPPFEGADLVMYNLTNFVDKVRSEYTRINGQQRASETEVESSDEVVVAPALADNRGKCYQFENKGSCVWGDQCRFQHSRGGGGRGPSSRGALVAGRGRAQWTRPPPRNYSTIEKAGPRSHGGDSRSDQEHRGSGASRGGEGKHNSRREDDGKRPGHGSRPQNFGRASH